MELTLEEFGKRLSVVRHARHRTQKEFGAPIGLSKTAMSKVEHGTQNLDYMQVATLAEAHRFCLNALYKPYWDITACLQACDEPKPEAPK